MSTQESTQAHEPGQVREGQRIAKLMARAGLCSRRDAEQWIAAGRVSVNGEVLTSPAFNVSETDDVRVDGEPLRAVERTRLFLFHKPRGLVTTARDPEGRPTIFDALPQDLPRVVAIGRLDINSEGLLLLTNDGGLSRVLELPATGWLRRYRVRAHGEITQEQLDSLRDGVTIDGIDYLGIEARFERQQGSNVWLTMGLREGKNREIKRVLEHMGLSVNRLIRVSFGPFELGDLEEGAVDEIRTRVLRDQLGPKLARAAQANFEAPIDAPAAPPLPPPELMTRGDRPPRRPRDDEEPERSPRPKAVEPRKRKHVSVLRAEAREEAAGPRKRIARAVTSDRKGREVKVERVMLARPPERAAGRTSANRTREASGGERRPRDAAHEPRHRDNASRDVGPRFGARGAESGERRDRDARRTPRAAGGERPHREFAQNTSAEPRSRDDARGPRRDAAPRFGGGGVRSGDGRDRDAKRPPRAAGGERPHREFVRNASAEPRSRDDARGPRRDAAPRFGAGGAKSGDRRDREERPSRESGGKPYRREAGSERFGAKGGRDDKPRRPREGGSAGSPPREGGRDSPRGARSAPRDFASPGERKPRFAPRASPGEDRPRSTGPRRPPGKSGPPGGGGRPRGSGGRPPGPRGK
jgi:23S rRNA pseudouridine2605 synthase